MALFGLSKKKREQKEKAPAQREEKKAAPKKKKKAASSAAAHTASPSISSHASVLLRPHVTEKAAHLTAQNVYAFKVAPNATKQNVATAVRALYKVVPLKVAIVRVPKKRVQLRTRRGWGTKGGFKKAYVYLKKGDRIEFAT